MSCLSFIGKTRHAHEIDTSTKLMIKHGFNKKVVLCARWYKEGLSGKDRNRSYCTEHFAEISSLNTPPLQTKIPSKIVFIIEFQRKAAETQGC